MATGFSLVVWLAIFTLTRCEEPSIEISPSNNMVDVGTSVTLSCTIHNVGLLDTTGWYKTQQEEGMETADSIAQTPALLQPKYHDLGRFEFSAEVTEGPSLVLRLTISGVLPEDSGFYGCVKTKADPPGQREESWQELVVIQGVRELRMFGLPEGLPEDQAVEFHNAEGVELKQDSQKYFFRCMARGSSPEAEIRVTFGEELITDQFREESERIVQSRCKVGDVDDEACEEFKNLNDIVYTTNLTTMEYQVFRLEDKRKKFMCEAFLNGEPSGSIYIEPVTHYPPNVSCADLMVKSDEQNVTLICDVWASPPPTRVTWSWETIDGSTISLEQDQRKGLYYAFTTDGNNADHKRVGLNMQYAFANTFRMYYVEVDNGLAQQKVSMELLKDRTGASHSGSARNALYRFLLATLLCLLSLS